MNGNNHRGKEDTHREVYEYNGNNRRRKKSERRGMNTMGIVREGRKTERINTTKIHNILYETYQYAQ